jgi:leader peptidase (prepilin peptidase)/N-methyltransferase
MQWLDQTPALWYVLAGVIGLCVGSFLNVVVYRLPKMMQRAWEQECADLAGTQPPSGEPLNLLWPRSRCPACGHPIKPLENIPVLSWLWLGRKCSACGTPISRRYPMVELTAGLLAVLCAWYFGANWKAIAAMGFCWTLLILALIDLDTQLLPDDLTLPLLWGGLILNLSGTFAPLSHAVLGAVAGYLVLWTVFWAFKLLTGKKGMGYGDFKLLAALGAWLGWTMLPVIILLSSLVGALVGIGLILFARHDRQKPIPFGPYLAGAGLLALFLGPSLNQQYLGLIL